MRTKSIELEGSISDLVNEEVQLILEEDAEDLAAFKVRAHEPNLSFEDVVRDLKERREI